MVQIGRELERRKKDWKLKGNAYKVAYAKADEASKSLQLLEQKLLSVKADQEYNEFNVISADDEEEDLYRSLERARKSALRKKDEKEEKASGSPEAIAFLATTSTGKSQIPNAADDDQNRIPSSSEDQSGEKKVVITETNEFLVGLKLDQSQSHMDPESEDVSNMQEDDHAEETTVNVAGGWTEVNDGIEREDKEHINPPAEDHKEEKGVSDGIFREVAVGKGLSGPLKLLKERGSLEVKHDTDAVQMTDELGRPMTQKEAYNRLSHAFHRKGPGKRKQEKRMKQFEKEQKLKQMNSSDTPLQSMERVRDAQAQLRKPYLVLRGHV